MRKYHTIRKAVLLIEYDERVVKSNRRLHSISLLPFVRQVVAIEFRAGDKVYGT